MMPASILRSQSAPPTASSNNQADTEDETYDFPAFAPDDEHDQDVPGWTRALKPSNSGRHSRASSIISTRTRFSTTTLDEVRSIEINAGGHTFRISRDGSQIIDVSAPPPYPGPFAENEDTPEHSIADVEDQQSHEVRQVETAQPESRKRVRIVMPGEEDEDTEFAAGQSNTPNDRVLTKADLYQIMLDLPLQLKRMLGIRMPGHVQRSHSAEELTSDQMAKTEAIESYPRDSSHTNSEKGAIQSPSLPESSGYGLAGFQPRSRHDSVLQHVDYLNENSDTRSSIITPQSPQQEQDRSEDVHMTVGDLNELSLLYNGVIRDLDREHRRRLHERDKEMERLRSMLHEKDIVYRQQLRGKDFIIEDLKSRLTHHEDAMEKQLELARNEVEEIWEKRWKTQESHLIEQITRKDEAGRKNQGGATD